MVPSLQSLKASRTANWQEVIGANNMQTKKSDKTSDNNSLCVFVFAGFPNRIYKIKLFPIVPKKLFPAINALDIKVKGDCSK